MDVHEVVNHTALDVTFVSMNQDLVSGIKYFHERKILFDFFIQRFISSLVVLNSLDKIFL